ncbi:MAG: OB-fold domain-containing protein [Caulobacteraceae bacterium]
MAELRKIPAPEPTPETQVFWDAAREGRLLIGRCVDTGRAFYPPRACSPFTLGETTAEASGGEGTIYTFSIMRRTPTGPLAIGYVTLDEGPSLLTNFTGCEVDALRIGQRVRVVFTPTDSGPPVPTFTPIDTQNKT